MTVHRLFTTVHPSSELSWRFIYFLFMNNGLLTTFGCIWVCQNVPKDTHDIPEHCQRLSLYKKQSAVWCNTTK
ncbi:hypothetical protein EKN42_17480 [Enterobacter hormaechei]|nr:hypothetical protein EEI76_15180 [Enterobacter cloacae]RTP38290.1 hypothetical protein EKN42_17480 [Enterobacter hormaechei]